MAYVFRGGIYLDENKNTRKCQIEKLTPPARLRIALSCSENGLSASVVAVGDNVLRGQYIGHCTVKSAVPKAVITADADKDIADEYTVMFHSPVSGKVVGVTCGGDTADVQSYIEIENDMQYTISPDIKKCDKKLSECSSDEIIDIIRRAGICGMGGDGYPAYKKIADAVGKAEYCIINCVECEPYVTGDYRLILERPAAVINGIKIILKALGLRHAVIAVGENRRDVTEKIKSLIGESKMIGMSVVRSKYPQGEIHQLIYAITGREIPADKNPADAGMTVFNVQTCAAIFNAFATGLPQLSRIVTVDGDCVTRPANIIAPIGTSFTDLADFCGGLRHKPAKIISGSPMRGLCYDNIEDAYVGKTTKAALFFSDKITDKYEQPPTCIRCGRCVSACPMHLMPNYIYTAVRAGKFDVAMKYGAAVCCECGICSYVCPGKAPVTEYIHMAKRHQSNMSDAGDAEKDDNNINIDSVSNNEIDNITDKTAETDIPSDTADDIIMNNTDNEKDTEATENEH